MHAVRLPSQRPTPHLHLHAACGREARQLSGQQAGRGFRDLDVLVGAGLLQPGCGVDCVPKHGPLGHAQADQPGDTRPCGEGVLVQGAVTLFQQQCLDGQAQ